jgi:hypothetical protein
MMSIYDELSSTLAYEKTGFELWTTLGLRVLVLFLFRSSPAFYPPKGWLDPILPILSLPFAPSGSVSVAVWFVVCTQIVEMIVRIYRSTFKEEIRTHPTSMASTLDTIVNNMGHRPQRTATMSSISEIAPDIQVTSSVQS